MIGKRRRSTPDRCSPRKSVRILDRSEDKLLAIDRSGESVSVQAGPDDHKAGFHTLGVCAPYSSSASASLPDQTDALPYQRSITELEPSVDTAHPVALSGALYAAKRDFIAHWAVTKDWPQRYFEHDDKQNTLARPKSQSLSKSRSTMDGITNTITSQTETKPREQKSADYRTSRYNVILETKGVHLRDSDVGISSNSSTLVQDLLKSDGEVPETSLFRDDIFRKTCEMIQDRNEARVIRDIALLIVPSAEQLTIFGAAHLKILVESTNECWKNSIPITKTRPQPDYAVGFRRAAFTEEQLVRMQPIIGDFMDDSYFMATIWMYFPFLACEIKCGAAALDIADRQNAHSTAIAARAVVELFRAVGREKELHREILAFSISHDNRTVRIYAHYVEFGGSKASYYRHAIHTFDFIGLNGRDKWTAYRFTRKVYDVWMPMHFKRICSAIDQIPPGINFDLSSASSRM